MPAPQRRWSRRAKLIWGVNAALALGLATVLVTKHHRAQVKQRTAQTQIEQPLEYARAPITTLPRTLSFPREPLHFREIPKGNYCAMYSRLAAESLFGITYQRGDAWNFAKNNRSVWIGATTHVNDVQAILQPGHVIGLYNPSSNFNSPERAYTHTALYVGKANGKHWIMQRVGINDRLEPLEDFLATHPGWGMREIIAPRNN